ncbi:MAG TPA: hypothetical protein VIN08_06375 [Ohtaekwangia sp.]|uniref:hypothetical protein n=1 Tax=Ohtaekwangia sp. TaxID=2066019 RepID=UPI002F92B3EB
MIRGVSFISAFLYLFIAGCTSRNLSGEDLTAFAADESHGLHKSVAAANNVTIDVTYRPTDLLVYQEVGKSKTTPQQIDSLRKKYSQYLYFILSLSANNKEALHQTGGEQYGDLVQTLSFRMNNYVTLTTSVNDSIPVGDFMLNRTYGMSRSTDLLFVFNKEKANGKDWVQFNLNEFGLGIGNQRLRFEMDDLEDIPKVTFEN